jgi:GGDEF domain-containing protein
MPETDAAMAEMVAERLRASIETTPFTIADRALTLSITASLGLATLRSGRDAGYVPEACGRGALSCQAHGPQQGRRLGRLTPWS